MVSQDHRVFYANRGFDEAAITLDNLENRQLREPRALRSNKRTAVIQGPLRAAPLRQARSGRWVTRADLSLDSKAAEQNQASLSTANRSFIEATIHLDDRGILGDRRDHRAGCVPSARHDGFSWNS
jgi:hypothetical protein